MKPYLVAMTGASGAIYGVRLVHALVELGRPLALIVSEQARLVIREELGHALKSYTDVEELASVFGLPLRGRLEAYSPKDFTAPVASGSYPTSGMVIIPCSMGTLGAIASGVSQNLIHRAADCTLKEGRKLIVVPRETPLNAIHLENMLKLVQAGAKVVPAMPGFYSGMKNLDEMADFMVGKVLDQMEIPHSLYPRWTGTLHPMKEKGDRPDFDLSPFSGRKEN